MAGRKMHAHEISTDVGLVRRLLAAQFPEWAELPIEHFPSSGTVNALYRLGDDLVVRLARTDWGVGAIDRELRWLPRLAPLLPVEIPVPHAKGRAGEGYPWDWGVYPWLAGEHPAAGAIAEQGSLARDLARFVAALHGVDLANGPPSGRGASLTRFDEPTRAALPALEGVIDTDAATAAWDEAVSTPEWAGAPVWVHGDLMPGNLLVRGDTLAAVIDWGGVGVGDPACDLAVAWNTLAAGGREVLRTELDVDDATWARGRGWALWTGLVALPYYEQTNPVLAENARYRIGEVLADYDGPA
ncbi:MAG: aminoglycoside phosphotransferase family protein [Gaiellaceae bacterium]